MQILLLTIYRQLVYLAKIKHFKQMMVLANTGSEII